METVAPLLISVGAILLLGLLTTALAERTPLPSVTLLLVFGVLIGPEAFDLLPLFLLERFELIADVTLLMVGFLLGSRLTRQELAGEAAEVMWISISAALLTALLVSGGLMLLGVAAPIAVLLGCIASATDAAAVFDVVQESTTGSGPRHRLGELLLSITAIDDVWAVALFGVGLAVATSLAGNGHEMGPLLWALRELSGGVLVGLLVGVPAAALTGRLRDGQPILMEALGVVLLCGGLALWLEVSHLIAVIVMGSVIANLASHHEVPFHAIEGIERPFLVLFFVLAGASLDVGTLARVGGIGAGYVALRAAGKVVGARAGAQLGGADPLTCRWIGLGLLPQAGVAMGMALVASHRLPTDSQLLLSIVVSSTVLFELVGPVLVRLALQRFRAA